MLVKASADVQQSGLTVMIARCDENPVETGDKPFCLIIYYLFFLFYKQVFGSIEASILPCHGSDPGSIPGQRVLFFPQHSPRQYLFVFFFFSF